LVGKPEGERDHLQDIGVDGRIVWNWIGRAWTAFIWLRICTRGRLLWM
jgi:hypothetical protein